MKIIQWNMRFFPLIGGIETHISTLVQEMPDFRFEIMTNALKGELLSTQFSENARVHRFRPYDLMRGHRKHWGRKVLLPISATNDVLRTLRQRRFLQQTLPDLVHLHDIDKYFIEIFRQLRQPRRLMNLYNGMFCPEKLHAPCLLTKHFDMMQTPQFGWSAWEKSFTLQFQNIIVLTEARKDFWQRAFKKNGRSAKIWCIPNGVDIKMFSPSQHQPGVPFTVGYAGRLDAPKGEALLAEILKNLPKNVVFHGAFSSFERVPQWLKDLPSHKCKISYDIPYTSMPDFYRSLNAIINTTLIKANDRSILEAMACGIPVIKVNTGDDFPVVNGKTGLLLPPESHAFITAITDVASNQEQVRKFSREASKLVAERFDAKVLTAKIREIYLSLMGS